MASLWLLYAFLMGSLALVLVFALVNMARWEEDRAARDERILALSCRPLSDLDPRWETIRSRNTVRTLAATPKRGTRMAA